MKGWLPRGYSLLAPWYDFTACVCSWGGIPHAQRTLLQALPQVHDLLIVGGGTGSCLRFLPWERMDGLVTFVDIAPGMIRRAHGVALTLGVANRVQFLQQPVEQVNPQQRWDAIYTPFFLDQFSQARCETVQRFLDAMLVPDGLWVHVDFTREEKEPQARLYLATMIPLLYGFFRLTCGIEARTLPNPEAFWREQQYLRQWQTAYPWAAIRSCILKKPAVCRVYC